MILPAQQDRGIVVFWIWQSLSYEVRLALSFGLILIGLIIQFVTDSLPVGVAFIACGNLFLLVQGYDNRVDVGKYDPRSDWERVGTEKLAELLHMDQKMKSWDVSALDVTNIFGAIVFIIVAGLLGFAVYRFQGAAQILAFDALVLLVPHWITGVRSILRKPKLMIKVDTIWALLEEFKGKLANHQVAVLMLLQGKETRLPSDVKFKVDIKDRHQDFLGLYGQVVLNDVQGTSYPYFYVVLVARKGFGLRDALSAYNPPHNITKEFKVQDEVEVAVIRQTTTKTSGYHTKPHTVNTIFSEGLRFAEGVAKGPKDVTA